jgi:hypothetical protein
MVMRQQQQQQAHHQYVQSTTGGGSGGGGAGDYGRGSNVGLGGNLSSYESQAQYLPSSSASQSSGDRSARSSYPTASEGYSYGDTAYGGGQRYSSISSSAPSYHSQQRQQQQQQHLRSSNVPTSASAYYRESGISGLSPSASVTGGGAGGGSYYADGGGNAAYELPSYGGGYSDVRSPAPLSSGHRGGFSSSISAPRGSDSHSIYHHQQQQQQQQFSRDSSNVHGSGLIAGLTTTNPAANYSSAYEDNLDAYYSQLQQQQQSQQQQPRGGSGTNDPRYSQY